MKNPDSWNSEFRKTRFYEKQEEKRNKKYLITRQFIPKTIAVMLDLDGTTDFIDDKKAKLFIKQLELIKAKFKAQLGTISISTHYRDPSKMQSTLDILARHLTKHIKIDINFFYGGIYDYNKKEIIYQETNFNSNKVNTFYDYHINTDKVNNQWFVIIDDNISEDVCKKYKNNHPMLLCRPSQHNDNLTNNCFMSISTTTKGFDGVLEALNHYIDSIKDLSPKQILETQRNLLTHLSSYELGDIIRKRNYPLIERYFTEGYADEEDYKDALDWLTYNLSHQTPTEEELIQIQNILQIIAKKFQSNNDEPNTKNVKKLQKKFTTLQHV